MPDVHTEFLKEAMSGCFHLLWHEREQFIVERTFDIESIEKQARSILRNRMKSLCVRMDQNEMKFSRLELCWMNDPEAKGKGIDYLEFVVDGQPLKELLHTDNLPWFGVTHPDWARQLCEQALLLQEPCFAYGRVPLYLCAACADPACGAITVRIQKRQDSYFWSSFCHEVTYTPSTDDYASYRTTGPFRFHKAQYSRCLWEGLDRYVRR